MKTKTKIAEPKINNAAIEFIQSHRYSTPYVLTDLSKIGIQCKLFNSLLPDVELFYALKCNNSDQIVQNLKDKVSGYDVASTGEIKTLRQNGVSIKKMIFSNPVKSPKEIKKAYKLGINNYAFQSSNELKKLSIYAPQANVYIRLRVDNKSKKFSFAVSGEKFGADINSAVKLMIEARKLGLKPNGISFHVGSQMSDPKAWSKALEQSFILAKNLSKHGIKTAFINIGGGFPVNYGEMQPGCDIKSIAKYINNTLKKSSIKGIKIIAEVGRFLVAESSQVVTSIIGTEARGNKKWLTVDASIFHTFIEKFGFNEFPWPIYSLEMLRQKNKKEKLIPCAISGPSCDSYDILSTSKLLPERLGVGGRIVIGCAGAYGLVYASQFNGFKIPKNYFFESIKGTN